MLTEKTNVIIIMTDQQKANAINLYGNPICKTPALEKLAEEGIICEKAFTPHPLCVPARVSFWTSSYPHQHGSRRNETLINPQAVHPFSIWKKAGYRTALLGKNHCFRQNDRKRFFDVWCEMNHTTIFPDTSGMEWEIPVQRVQQVFNEHQKIELNYSHISPVITDKDPDYHPTGALGIQANAFLEAHQDNPFCLWLSFPHPHEPYIVPRKYYDMFPIDQIEIPPLPDPEKSAMPEHTKLLTEMLRSAEIAPDDLKRTIAAYYGNIRFIDDVIGNLLAKLEELNLKENTLVVFCSDHGDFMGEWGMTVKGGVFHDSLTKIPLILSGPGIPAGIRETSFTSLIDIIPTILKLQGLPTPSTMIGNLLPSIYSGQERTAIFSEYGAGMDPMPAEVLKTLQTQGIGNFYESILATLQWREAEGRRKMVRTDSWKYVYDPLGDTDELYNLINDPHELYNLAPNHHYREVVNDMKSTLLDWSIKSEDPVPVPHPIVKYQDNS